MGQSVIGIVVQSILAGTLFGFLVYTIAEGPLALMAGKRKKFEDKVQRAAEEGHCVKARLVRCYDDVENYGKKQHSYIADYEYFVNGKRYQRTYDFYRRPTNDELVLYWFTDPAKADTVDVLQRKDNHLPTYIIAGIVIAFVCGAIFR